MPTWIALLRGINVGGRGKLPMADLRALLEGLGCERVATYIQSGNCAFRSRRKSAPRLARAIEAAMEAAHGFRPTTLVRSLDEVEAALDGNPFPDGDPGRVHLFFLAAPPGAVDLPKLEALASPTEALHLTDAVAYLHAPDGIGRSKLAGSLERLLPVEVTARNLRTVTKLVELARTVEG